MKAHEFIFWLKGYLEGIDPETKSLDEVIDEITKKAEEVDLNPEVIEKIIEELNIKIK